MRNNLIFSKEDVLAITQPHTDVNGPEIAKHETGTQKNDKPVIAAKPVPSTSSISPTTSINKPTKQEQIKEARK